MHEKIWLGDLKERYRFEDLDADGRMVLFGS
jgi:hypothetical protein